MCNSLFFSFLFFQKVAWLESCLKCTKGPGIERAMFFLFSGSQLHLCSHSVSFCNNTSWGVSLSCLCCPCSRVSVTPMSTQQSASRMGHLAERGLQGCVGASRNKFVSSFFLRLYHIPLTDAEKIVSVIKSLLFWKHQAFQMWPSAEPTCVRVRECNRDIPGAC